MIFGPEKITTGAGNDIERATAMARQMVTRFGMSDVIGLMAIGQADQEVFLGRELVQRREISEHTAQQVDQEMKRVLDEAEERARAIVQEHKDLLERIAQALLERETLDAVDIAFLEAGEELPPLPTEDDEAEDESAEPEEGPAGVGEMEADAADAELDAAPVDEVEKKTVVVPTAVKLGDEPSGDEDTSPGTVRTPAVQLSAEDPEADASS
jgi:cell division protease FtsH